MLENVENEILYGPFVTLEEEEMKGKCVNIIRLERSEINDFRRKHPEYYSK